MKLENLKNLESLLVGLSALDLKTSTEIKIDNCLKDVKAAIAVNGCCMGEAEQLPCGECSGNGGGVTDNGWEKCDCQK